MGLLQILSDQSGCVKSNIAASKPEIPISQLPGETEAMPVVSEQNDIVLSGHVHLKASKL